MGGKSKAQTIGYHYKWAMHLAWTRFADAVLEIRGGGATAWQGRITENTVLSINKPDLWGGEKGQGGMVGDMEVLFGGSTQAPSSYLAGVFGEKQSGNRGLVSSIWRGGRFGAFLANPKPVSMKFERIHAGSAGWYPEKAAIELVGGTSLAVDAVGWSYQVGADEANPGLENLVPPSDGWSTGQGPFGSGPSVPLPPNTAWPLHTVLWIERSIHLDGPADLTVQAENGAIVLVDGAIVATINTENIDRTDLPSVTVRVAAGGHTISIKGFDEVSEGGTVYLGVWIEGVQLIGRNPAHMIYEAITHAEMMGEPAGLVDDTSFTAAADQFFDEALGLCTLYDSSQESPEQYIQRICNVAGATCSQSRIDGKYYLDPIRGGYDIESLPLISEDDVLEFKQTPVVPNEAINGVCVKWRDPVKNEDRTTSPVMALGRVRDAGESIIETRNYPELPTESLALRVAKRDVDAASPVLSRFELTTRRKHRGLRPGQPFRFQMPSEGVTDAVLRLGSIRHGTHVDGRVRLVSVQDVFTMPATAPVLPSPGEWVAPSKVPVPAAAQTVFEAPYVEMVAAMSAADFAVLTDDAGYLLSVAALPGVGFNYAVATAAAGEEYVERGTADFSPTALVVEASPLEDPLATAFTLSQGSLLDRVEVGSWALWGDEIVRIDAIDADANTCTLARGCADTIPSAHAADERIWFCGDWVGSDAREYVDADVVSAKLLPRTSSGQLALAYAAALQVTMDQRLARPYPPGLFQINGSAYPATASGPLTVSWAHRDRVLQADQLVDSSAADVGPEAGTTYTVRWYANGVLEATHSGISGTSQSYTPVGDCTLTIELEAVRDGITSYQMHSHELAYGAGATDPNFANVSSLLHFDAADGSTTFTDQKGIIWSVGGNAHISTANPKFGAGALSNDGSGDYIAAADNVAFGFGTGDFTVECWVRRPVATAADYPLFDFRAASAQNGMFYLNVTNRRLTYYNGTVYGNTGNAPAQDAYAHVAFARESGTLRAFLDGVLQWSVAMAGDFGASRPCRIGSNFAATSFAAGDIDDPRITKGVARYTANFTPPAAPFPDS